MGNAHFSHGDCLFLGFFLDFLEITLIVLPVFTPLIVQMDFGDHLAHADIKFWFIILLAVNLQTSFLTPPFGFALFYMKGLLPAKSKYSPYTRGSYLLDTSGIRRHNRDGLPGGSTVANARGL